MDRNKAASILRELNIHLASCGGNVISSASTKEIRDALELAIDFLRRRK